MLAPSSAWTGTSSSWTHLRERRPLNIVCRRFFALVRLRYPMLNDRLIPYVLGGGGVGFVQVDDKFPPIGSTSLKNNDFPPVGALGGGLEYFIANNLAVGGEAKYLFQQAALGVNSSDNRI